MNFRFPSQSFSGVLQALLLASSRSVLFVAGEAESGITFSEVSDLLGPFENAPSDVNNGGPSGLQGMIFFDYDNDDDLDLFICASAPKSNALMQNNGDGTFTDVTDAAGLTNVNDCQGVTAGDLDNDGFVDLLVGGDLGNTGYYLYRNVDGSSFEDVSSTSGIGGVEFYWGNAMADYDNDGE